MDPPSKGIWRPFEQQTSNKNQTTLDLLTSYEWINIGSMHYGMSYFNICYIYIVSTYLYI